VYQLNERSPCNVHSACRPRVRHSVASYDMWRVHMRSEAWLAALSKRVAVASSNAAPASSLRVPRFRRIRSTLAAAPCLLVHVFFQVGHTIVNAERTITLGYSVYNACRSRLHVPNVLLVRTRCIHEKWHVIVIIVR
jgi:hypothetical protein